MTNMKDGFGPWGYKKIAAESKSVLGMVSLTFLT